jgi:hypothetical protein
LTRSVSALLGIRQGFGRVIKVKKPLYLHTVKVEINIQDGTYLRVHLEGMEALVAARQLGLLVV